MTLPPLRLDKFSTAQLRCLLGWVMFYLGYAAQSYAEGEPVVLLVLAYSEIALAVDTELHRRSVATR